MKKEALRLLKQYYLFIPLTKKHLQYSLANPVSDDPDSL